MRRRMSDTATSRVKLTLPNLYNESEAGSEESVVVASMGNSPHDPDFGQPVEKKEIVYFSKKLVGLKTILADLLAEEGGSRGSFGDVSLDGSTLRHGVQPRLPDIADTIVGGGEERSLDATLCTLNATSAKKVDGGTSTTTASRAQMISLKGKLDNLMLTDTMIGESNRRKARTAEDARLETIKEQERAAREEVDEMYRMLAAGKEKRRLANTEVPFIAKKHTVLATADVVAAKKELESLEREMLEAEAKKQKQKYKIERDLQRRLRQERQADEAAIQAGRPLSASSQMPSQGGGFDPSCSSSPRLYPIAVGLHTPADSGTFISPPGTPGTPMDDIHHHSPHLAMDATFVGGPSILKVPSGPSDGSPTVVGEGETWTLASARRQSADNIAKRLETGERISVDPPAVYYSGGRLAPRGSQYSTGATTSSARRTSGATSLTSVGLSATTIPFVLNDSRGGSSVGNDVNGSFAATITSQAGGSGRFTVIERQRLKHAYELDLARAQSQALKEYENQYAEMRHKLRAEVLREAFGEDGAAIIERIKPVGGDTSELNDGEDDSPGTSNTSSNRFPNIGDIAAPPGRRGTKPGLGGIVGNDDDGMPYIDEFEEHLDWEDTAFDVLTGPLGSFADLDPVAGGSTETSLLSHLIREAEVTRTKPRPQGNFSMNPTFDITLEDLAYRTKHEV